MSIDLERFHQTFFEESFEGLQAMEAALLGLDPESPDSETINTIFRAAHSIKGGAGTFGFSAISEFTHHLETLLDEVRAGDRQMDATLVDLVLRAVDQLRDMLEASRDGETVSADNPINEELQALLAGEAVAGPAVRSADTPAETVSAPWQIRFEPNEDMMLFGNDPLRIIRELGRLGDISVVADSAKLPSFADLNPEHCFLAWDIHLPAEVERAQIEEAFAWVEDDCRLSIDRQSASAAPTADASESEEITVKNPAEEAPAVADMPTPSAQGPAAPRAEEAETTAASKAPAKTASKESSSVRVDVEKIDNLINLVGELVITQSMLEQTASGLDPVVNEKLLTGLAELDRHTRHLQEAVMSTRMLPVDFVFSRFPRVVRDTARRLNKKVVLETSGEGAELDKGLVEKISDPLNHIVRNAIDHGIESAEDRRAAGKPEQATIRLSAWHQGGYIAIQVSDDGRGLNREKILQKARDAGMSLPDTISDGEVWQLIFAPGLSTAAEVTDISGRGVGMDVVRKNIQSLGGGVDIESHAGVGTKVTIRLPLTLAILDGMSVRVGDEIYILPLSSVVESQQPRIEDVKTMAGKGRVLHVRGEFLPILSMSQLFERDAEERALQDGIVVIVEAEGRQLALMVDELVGQQQVVIKSLEQNYRRIEGISGATILGDGRVALIVDVGDLVRAQQNNMATAA